MEIIKIQKGKRIAKRKDKVKEWYLIQSGSVIQKFGFAEIVLGQNAIIGIIERDWFICDYITKEDTALIPIPCKNADDLKNILAANERYRIVFLKTAIEQRHKAFVLYTQLQKRVGQFHAFVQTVYNDYKTFCNSYQLDEQAFPQIDYFNMLEMKHKAEAWEVNNSISLIQNVLKEYIQMMVKDDSLCVGVIMEAAAQMHRVMLGIGEMVTYLTDHKEILLSESENDIFHLYFDLAVRCGKRHLDIAPVKQELSFLSEFIRRIQIYEPSLIKNRLKQYEEYDFENAASAQLSKKVDVLTEDCLNHIMEFGQIGKEEADKFKNNLAWNYKFEVREMLVNERIKLPEDSQYKDLASAAMICIQMIKDEIHPMCINNYGYILNKLGLPYWADAERFTNGKVIIMPLDTFMKEYKIIPRTEEPA